MNPVVDQKLSSLSFSEIIPFQCVTFVAGKKPKLKNTRFCWDRIATVAPKISLNTSNATLRTQIDWKCHSQCWHVLFLRSWLYKFCIFFKYLLTEHCDSLSSWPCVNLGRLSHQKTVNKIPLVYRKLLSMPNFVIRSCREFLPSGQLTIGFSVW